jgi:hypothetical protein
VAADHVVDADRADECLVPGESGGICSVVSAAAADGGVAVAGRATTAAAVRPAAAVTAARIRPSGRWAAREIRMGISWMIGG